MLWFISYLQWVFRLCGPLADRCSLRATRRMNLISFVPYLNRSSHSKIDWHSIAIILRALQLLLTQIHFHLTNNECLPLISQIISNYFVSVINAFWKSVSLMIDYISHEFFGQWSNRFLNVWAFAEWALVSLLTLYQQNLGTGERQRCARYTDPRKGQGVMTHDLRFS